MSSPKPINNMLALLCSTFRCEIDSYQKRAYTRTLADIPGDVLLAAADQLINESASGRKFFPMPTAPDVKGACAKVVTAKRKQAAAIHLESCTHASQWMENERGQQERCPCWKRAQEAMHAVGQPLALPAATASAPFDLAPMEVDQ